MATGTLLHCMPGKQIIPKILFLNLTLAVLMTCGTAANERKPRPEGNQWILCPACDGTGFAEMYESARHEDKPVKTGNAAYSCAGDMLGLLFAAQVSEIKEKERHQGDPDRFIGPPLDKKDTRRSNFDQQASSGASRKVRIRCFQCGGRGWIIFQRGKQDDANHEKYKALGDLNKELNR